MEQFQLRAELLTRLESLSHPTGRVDTLTIGAEHEFFLAGPEGRPCTHEQGQAFLSHLGTQTHWYVRDCLQEPQMLWRVSREHSGGRYTAVKYDHHPHLFEVAFAYGNDLHALAQIIESVWNDILASAAAVGLQVRSEPLLNISPLAPEVTSALAAFRELRHYRGELLKSRNPASRSDGALNYAAVIAATQIHIGGSGWWRNPALVPALYRLEPEFLALTPSGASDHPDSRAVLLKKRWSGFLEVFRGYPLAGFPELKNWTLEGWSQALLDSPLCGGPSDAWAGRTAREFPDVLEQGLDSFIHKVRDLQIIRPKLYGTLEFRADPARSDPAGILRLAALRLGATAALLQDSEGISGADGGTLEEERRRWFEGVRIGVISHGPDRILELAGAGLRKRAKGEEVFLGKV